MEPKQADALILNMRAIFLQNLIPTLANIGLKLIGALLFWIIGRKIIGALVPYIERGASGRKMDPTAARYIASIVKTVLSAALLIAIFGFLGVQTATFAALLAGIGLAIGTAWGDLLKNFAAGVFLFMLRPFKVGDFVTTGGVTGNVEELGIFVCVINTPDNVRTIVGNARIFADTIQNFTANPHRRVELRAQLSGAADYRKAIAMLEKRIRQIPNVVANPVPEITILEFNPAGPVLAVRPYTHNDNYWQVYFDTNSAIQDELTAGGFPPPAPLFTIKQN